MDEHTSKLLELARSVRENAYAPLSHFRVGAVVVGESGKEYVGCNVESPTYTLTSHAEMNAIDTAIANGERRITRVVIVLDSPHIIFPCALCRQKIAEFANPDVEVTTSTLDGTNGTKTIGELYPESFTLHDLEKE